MHVSPFPRAHFYFFRLKHEPTITHKWGLITPFSRVRDHQSQHDGPRYDPVLRYRPRVHVVVLQSDGVADDHDDGGEECHEARFGFRNEKYATTSNS